LHVFEVVGLLHYYCRCRACVWMVWRRC